MLNTPEENVQRCQSIVSQLSEQLQDSQETRAKATRQRLRAMCEEVQASVDAHFLQKERREKASQALANARARKGKKKAGKTDESQLETTADTDETDTSADSTGDTTEV